MDTKNQPIKRNIEKFPIDFMFKLTEDEKNELVAKCDRFEILKHSSSNPYVFTEHDEAKEGTKKIGFV